MIEPCSHPVQYECNAGRWCVECKLQLGGDPIISPLAQESPEPSALRMFLGGALVCLLFFGILGIAGSGDLQVAREEAAYQASK